MRPMNAGPPPPQFDDNANKLFVGNLAWGVDQSVLEQAFGKYGKVVECKVVTDRETGRSRGFGFVTMSTEAEANEALTRMNGAVCVLFSYFLLYLWQYIKIPPQTCLLSTRILLRFLEMVSRNYQNTALSTQFCAT